MNDELLINLIEQCPLLYDKTVKGYKDEKMKENSWTYVAKNLNTTPEIVRKRWNNLRDRFVRAYREYQSSGGIKNIEFPYFHLMIWLAPFIRRRKLTSSINEDHVNAINQIRWYQLPDESQIENEEEESTKVLDSRCKETPTPKINELHKSVVETLHVFKNICETWFNKTPINNECDLNFMKSVVEDMQILTTNNKLKFKKEVLELLIKYIDKT